MLSMNSSVLNFITDAPEKSTSFFSLHKYPFENFNSVQSSVLDHFEKDANFIIASSTNSGKTIMAEFFLFESLFNKDMKCIYICPLKSLASEKHGEWSKKDHPFSAKKITMMAGDEKKEKNADLTIATMESFCHNVRTKPELFQDVDTIVVDEAHILGTEDRGPTLEFALTEFSRTNSAKIIFLSGTLPNSEQVGNWLHELNKKQTYILNSTYQAVPLNIHYRKYDHKIPNDLFESIFKICDKHHSDKVLVFVHSKNVGKKLVNYIQSMGLDTKFHSADLSASKRKSLENEFKNGELRVLVATSTLAAGVNLPARRVIIAGVVRGNDYVNKADIRQMIGRAGRKGIDDTGDAYVFIPSDRVSLVSEYKKVDNVLSKLFVTNSDFEYHKLAGHLLALINREKNLNFDKIWNMLCRSFGGFNEKMKASYLDNTIKKLITMNFVELANGTYKLKKLGLASVLFFIDPYDLYSWVINFSKYFKNNVRKDSLLSYYIASIPSNNKVFMSQDEREFCSQYVLRLNELLGSSFVETGTVKIGYLYYCLMTNRSAGILSPLIPMIMKDIGRILACLNLAAKICGWNCEESFFLNLKNRICGSE